MADDVELEMLLTPF